MPVSSTTDPDASSEEPSPAPDGVLAGGPRLLVWLLTAFHTVLLMFYRVLVPTWRGPDEHNQVDLVVALTEDGAYPAYDHGCWTRGYARRWDRCGPRTARATCSGRGGARAERPARSDPDEVGRDIELGMEFEGRAVSNHMAQHPPAYYVYLAASSVVTDTLAPGTGLGSYDREVVTLRLLSLILLAPLPLLAWVSARVAGASEAAAVGRRGTRRDGAVTVALLLPTVLLGGFMFFSGLRLYQMSTVATMVQGC